MFDPRAFLFFLIDLVFINRLDDWISFVICELCFKKTREVFADLLFQNRILGKMIKVPFQHHHLMMRKWP